MNTFKFRSKTYQVDDAGFLMKIEQWDEDFAEGMAEKVQIDGGLTQKHWEVINYIRNIFSKLGKCPAIYQTCRMNELRMNDLKALFPTGYLRGACKIAGLTYKESGVSLTWLGMLPETFTAPSVDKVYSVDVNGFLMDPEEWDELYCAHKASEMKMAEKLTDTHWQIIRFLRESYRKNGVIPTVYETCERNNLEIEDLESLFPDGYHRGAVKISGLKAR